MIKAVGFDLYGTLLKKEAVWKGPFTLLFERFRQDPNFERKYTARTYAVELMIGNFKNVRSVCKNFGVTLSDEEIREFERLIKEDVKRVHPIRGSSELIESVRERGAKVFLISNLVYPYEVPAIWHGIQRKMDAVFHSFRVGIVKPNPRIFRLASRVLEIRPEEMIFVGDSPKNDAIGPQKIGMRSASIVDFRERTGDFMSGNA